MSEKRLSLIKELLGSSITEYSNAQAGFNTIDTKAQNTSTIAGIFLASSLALLNSKIFEKIISIGKLPLIILIIITSLLMVSIIFCLLAMRIRNVSIIKLDKAKEELDSILQQPESELETRYENFLLSRIKDWITIAKNARKKNEEKANLVRWGQISLGTSIIFVSFLMFYILLNGMNTTSTIDNSCQEVIKNLCR